MFAKVQARLPFPTVYRGRGVGLPGRSTRARTTPFFFTRLKSPVVPGPVRIGPVRSGILRDRTGQRLVCPEIHPENQTRDSEANPAVAACKPDTTGKSHKEVPDYRAGRTGKYKEKSIRRLREIHRQTGTHHRRSGNVKQTGDDWLISGSRGGGGKASKAPVKNRIGSGLSRAAAARWCFRYDLAQTPTIPLDTVRARLPFPTVYR